MSSPTSLVPGNEPTTLGSSTGHPETGSPDRSSGKGARARQRADTRERIFETALREFRDVGFGAAQVDRIAKAAGVARGTFYFHFATKDDVLLELARRINARIARRVAVLGESGPSLQELLLRVNDAIMDEHSRVGEAGLLSEMLSLYVRRPHDVQDPKHNLPTLSVELARHLRAAGDRGELQSSLSPDQIGIVLITSLFGIYTRIPQGAELRAACESLVELLVKGLRAPD
jgi:TetR/AcrR family transcriptional regulator, repressor for uid operon